MRYVAHSVNKEIQTYNRRRSGVCIVNILSSLPPTVIFGDHKAVDSAQEPWLERVMGWRGGGPCGVQPSPDSWLRQTGCPVAPSVKTGTMEGVRLQKEG